MHVVCHHGDVASDEQTSLVSGSQEMHLVCHHGDVASDEQT
jgi:hypothetical protein